MKLSIPFVSYASLIKPDICKKIIDLGISKIKKNKKEGLDVKGTTLNDKHREKINLERDKISNYYSSEDKTVENLRDLNVDLDKYLIRDSEVGWLDDKWIYDIFLPIIRDANRKAGWGWNVDTAELFQFTVYHGDKKQGGFYGWHSDGSSDHIKAYKPALKISNDPLRFKSPKKNENNKIILNSDGEPIPDMDTNDLPLKKNGKSLAAPFSQDKKKWGKVRKISMTVNLNNAEDYEGGNLKFDLGPHFKGERFKVFTDMRSQGSIIIFPSFMYHCVTPVISGIRYSLVLWLLGKPWQ
ncbi:2OG-Fe(II) oxygenase [Candidatus Pelagibacter sp. HIMB1715]|uniref:2OG-Fe(II) oxygenase n=1 Tax=Candidatus Pelagibacter sp. HIMB1715 TaxID=3413369 RepID=UPI003F8798C2